MNFTSTADTKNPDRLMPGELGLRKDFAVGDSAAVDVFLEQLKQLNLYHLRFAVPCTDLCTGENRHWYAWLLSRVMEQCRVCIVLGPRDASTGFASGADELQMACADLLKRHGEAIDAIELPVIPWEHRLGSAWPKLCHQVAGTIREAGTRCVLASAQWHEQGFVSRCMDSGILQAADIVGLELTAAGCESEDATLPQRLRQAERVLQITGAVPPLWLSRVELHPNELRPFTELAALNDALSGPAQRTYWEAESFFPNVYNAQDVRDGNYALFGLKTPARFLKPDAGVELRELQDLCQSPRRRVNEPAQALITGGAGFVGANLADRLLAAGERVIIYDNLARSGTESNLFWLKQRYGDRVSFYFADVCDRDALSTAVDQAAHVYHFAGQVAVTSSLQDPLHDNDVNVRGTLALLEALRALTRPPPLIFTSTNKVYGALDDVILQVNQSRYEPVNKEIRNHGIGENRPLNFCSPYGCSKGAADQYVLDYCKTFGIPTVCFRMSCIYGRRQFGNEDQGWVAHFIKQAVTGSPITIFGDGLQVRDVLFADDLVNAFLLCRDHMPAIQGKVFNIGGGPANVLSLVELLDMIEQLAGRAPAVSFEIWRPSDQRYYASDTGQFQRATGWRPRIGVAEGVRLLYEWMLEEFGEREKDETVETTRILSSEIRRIATNTKKVAL